MARRSHVHVLLIFVIQVVSTELDCAICLLGDGLTKPAFQFSSSFCFLEISFVIVSENKLFKLKLWHLQIRLYMHSLMLSWWEIKSRWWQSQTPVQKNAAWSMRRNFQSCSFQLFWLANYHKMSLLESCALVSAKSVGCRLALLSNLW